MESTYLAPRSRVRVVESELAFACRTPRRSEVQADRLGVTDVEIAVRLRRKTSDDRLVLSGIEVGAHDVADEVLARFFRRGLGNCHDAIVPCLDSKG